MEKNKSFNIFLDDERNPEDCANYMPVALKAIYRTMEWVVVRSHEEFVRTITDRGLPNIISFDHDLADEHYQDLLKEENWDKDHLDKVLNYESYQEKTGYDSAKWLLEYCMENKKQLPEYFVHSQNPVGKDNIQSLLTRFKDQV